MLLRAGTEAEHLYGYARKEALGKRISLLIPSNHSEKESSIFERVRCGDHAERYDTVRQRKDGSLVEVALSISHAKNLQGEIIGTSQIARDITERKQSEQQIAILAGEAEHRAKNLLATVQATVRLLQSDTPEGLKRSIEGRIRALANVHTLFVQSRWIGAELSRIVKQELAPYSVNEGGRVRTDGPELMLAPNMAQTIAVILHELATNAAKYGALSVAKGHVTVAWSRASDERFILRWTERGGPPTKAPSHQGFGTRILEQMIRQHEGKSRLDWSEEGFEYEVALRM